MQYSSTVYFIDHYDVVSFQDIHVCLQYVLHGFTERLSNCSVFLALYFACVQNGTNGFHWKN